MIFLDTNYLVRFFVGDVKDQARKAKALIERSPKIYITSIVLAETVYILEKHYEATKKDVCTNLLSFLRQTNIVSESFLPLALEIYEKESISFYDCLLASEVVVKKGKLKTFDKKLNRIVNLLT